ncbi:cytochrome c family protein [Alphaproteobacteria bacterium]|nr:cytochrome c family protein [Alphaproteobacteria bacterium]
MRTIKSPIKTTKAIIIAASLLALPTGFALAGDAEKGAKVYRKCASCHMIGDGAKNRVGPQLNNIIGREIGAIAGYKYSKAMVKYAAAEKVWNEENLAAYLESPRKVVKGGRMAFAGLRKETDRNDIIAYLKQAAK